ncbi:hypothetical protein B0H14DRAFT_3432680 [Mycena olivaceomarginata]|nr:hypothetical protein B0H14DRAFT_3432680 [Mycena olivaceomarginata]
MSASQLPAQPPVQMPSVNQAPLPGPRRPQRSLDAARPRQRVPLAAAACEPHAQPPHYRYDMHGYGGGGYAHPHPHHGHEHYKQHQHHPAPFPPQHLAPGAPNHGGGGAIQVVHTDNAATRLSDRARAESASIASPLIRLCNKCGLFECAHSCPRPEQFPHKCGPLATSALNWRSQSRTPNAQPQQQNYTTQPYYPPPLRPPPRSTRPRPPNRNRNLKIKIEK